jgi:hypothetical protein
MRVMRWDCEPHRDKEAPGPPTRLLIAATAGSPVRGVPFAFVLLASAALWVLQCSPASAQPTLCTGDCNNNGFVTVNELLKGVNIALGTLRLSQCSGFDLNRDGTVTVDLNAAPCTYLCVWGLESSLAVRMLNENTGQLQNIADMVMSDYAESAATYAYDDYPIPKCP